MIKHCWVQLSWTWLHISALLNVMLSEDSKQQGLGKKNDKQKNHIKKQTIFCPKLYYTFLICCSFGGCFYIYLLHLFLAGNSGHLYWSCYWAVRWSWFAQVNVLCNLPRKKSQEVTASFLGWFLSRCCFTLCMEVECRIMKKYKCCSCKNYWGKGMEGGKKVSLHCFWLTRRPQVCGKNVFWGIL